ncbi:hypothetical protein [Pseudomonas sp. NPDC012596]|uniref:hypothetical protein n=1 Tax=Pseudomonas sp. NPDC012596 TaxID=3364419 RepID=UPI0036A35EE0
MEVKGKWGKIRTLAGLAALGFVGSVGQYTIQNSKFPDWLTAVFSGIGTSSASIISAFLDTSIPLPIVVAFGLAIAFVTWLVLSRHANKYEVISNQHNKVLKEFQTLEKESHDLRAEKLHLYKTNSNTQDLLAVARADRNNAIEELEAITEKKNKLEFECRALHGEVKVLDFELSAARTALKNATKDNDTADISPTTIQSVHSFIISTNNLGHYTTPDKIIKSLKLSPATVQNALNDLIKRKTIIQKTAPNGLPVYLPRL